MKRNYIHKCLRSIPIYPYFQIELLLHIILLIVLLNSKSDFDNNIPKT